MDKRKIIKNILSINEEITNIESSMNNPYYEGNGFIYLEKLRTLVFDLHLLIFEDDDKENTIISFIEEIINNDMRYFDTDLINDKEKYLKKYKKSTMSFKDDGIDVNDEDEYMEAILLDGPLLNSNPQAWITFNNIDEILDYIEKKKYFSFK